MLRGLLGGVLVMLHSSAARRRRRRPAPPEAGGQRRTTLSGVHGSGRLGRQQGAADRRGLAEAGRRRRGAALRAAAEMALGRFAEAAETLEALARGGSPEKSILRASLYGQAAHAWLSADRPDQAEFAATQALALAPGDAELLVLRARARAGQHRLGKRSAISTGRSPPTRAPPRLMSSGRARCASKRRWSPPRPTSTKRSCSILGTPRRCSNAASSAC